MGVWKLLCCALTVLQLPNIYQVGADSHLGSFYSHRNHKRGDREIRVFVGVLSYIGEFDRRKTIRKTWGRDMSLFNAESCCASFDVRFFVSVPDKSFNRGMLRYLYSEVENYGDVVMLKHSVEDYHKITDKTLEIMRMANARGGFTHVVKTDTDTYIRVPPMADLIRGMPASRALLGKLNVDGVPYRNGKWGMDEADYPFSDYPKYAQGSLYIVTADIAAWIASSMRINSHLKIEDVSMGMWLMFYGKDVTYVNDSRLRETGCEEGDITSHYQTPHMMECIHSRNRRSMKSGNGPYHGCCNKGVSI